MLFKSANNLIYTFMYVCAKLLHSNVFLKSGFLWCPFENVVIIRLHVCEWSPLEFC